MFLHVQKHKTQQKTIKKVHLSLMNRAMNANKSISNPLKIQQDWKWSVKTLLFNNGTKSENSTENWDFKNSSRKALIAKHYFVSYFLILSYTQNKLTDRASAQFMKLISDYRIQEWKLQKKQRFGDSSFWWLLIFCLHTLIRAQIFTQILAIA